MEPQNSPLQFYRKIQPQIAAIVLAGGQSSRMGRDKALIEVGGVPLLHKICAAAQSCANPVYVIAPWVERYQSILPPGCQLIPEVPLPGGTSYQFKKRRRQMNWQNPAVEGDSHPATAAADCVSSDEVQPPKIQNPKSKMVLPHGPLVGFAQALAQVEGEWVLLLACDLPNLTVEEMQRWCGYLAQVPQEAIALLPRHTKGWEPLCGFYRRHCLTSLQEFIAGGGRSFQGWLAGNFVTELPVTAPHLLLNCNTPQDLPENI